MKSGTMQKSEQEAFIERCRAVGLKATPQRVEIYRELAGTKEHPDAETVYSRVRRRLPAISFDTVYRTLRSFSEHGLILRMSTSGDRARFDADTSEHHHFICERCGTIIDFDAERVGPELLPEELSTVGRLHSFHIEVRGICRSCENKEQNKKKGAKNHE